MTDVVVIGAGPAGMSAALGLLERGLTVTVVDDQPAPGGRIFAAIETRVSKSAEDRKGAMLVARFRACGGVYVSDAETWEIEADPIRVFLTHRGNARMLEPRFLVLATGAQERPMPFEGWQLPGVMTVGSAQILLKTAHQVPERPVWLAGTGPLLLLYARQLQQAGGRVAGILDTNPPGRWREAARCLPGAVVSSWRDLARGTAWLVAMRSVPIIREVVYLKARGDTRLESILFRSSDGTEGIVEADVLLLHNGVVPQIHGSLVAGCDHHWNAEQRCFEPDLNSLGESSRAGIFVVGDGATIRGAGAAALTGELAAIGIALSAGLITSKEAGAAAAPLHKMLDAAMRFRRFLDALYPPTGLVIPDEVMVCRCEEVTAGQIREELAARPHLGADGVKVETRAGMGPCQGRQCGLTLTRLVAETNGRAEADVGFLHIRPPLKPLTLRELATLEVAE